MRSILRLILILLVTIKIYSQPLDLSQDWNTNDNFIFSNELETEISKLIDDNNLLKNYKKNALDFSNNIFFEEKKLLTLLNKKLQYDA